MSTPRRFFKEDINYPAESEVTLDGEEFVHAKTVLRVGEGSEITLLDNSGREYSAIVVKVDRHSLTAHITGAYAGDKEPSARISLLCGALKGDKTELVVQKAVELGVSEIGIFSSQYCAAYMNEGKVERLNRVSREAAKQCLRSRAPAVRYYADLESALDSCAQYTDKLFFCEFATSTDCDLSALHGSVALVIGSEGGFSEDEFACAVKKGYAGVTLGKRILRAETAAIAACTLAAYLTGELQ